MGKSTDKERNRLKMALDKMKIMARVFSTPEVATKMKDLRRTQTEIEAKKAELKDLRDRQKANFAWVYDMTNPGQFVKEAEKALKQYDEDNALLIYGEQQEAEKAAAEKKAKKAAGKKGSKKKRAASAEPSDEGANIEELPAAANG